jgi:hypothetical protein
MTSYQPHDHSLSLVILVVSKEQGTDLEISASLAKNLVTVLSCERLKIW